MLDGCAPIVLMTQRQHLPAKLGGEIPFSYVGNRRKVKYADLRTYQEKLESDRLATLDKLSELDQELGLGYE